MDEPTPSMGEQVEEGKHIKNFLSNTEKAGIAKQTFSFLSNRLQLLETYWESVRGRHGTVCRENAELESSHPYFTQGWYYELENAYLDAKTELAARMSALAPPASTDPSISTARIQLLPQLPALPTLQIPKFGGDQRDWETFREMFCSMVKDVPSIPKAQKLARLMSSLEGPAAARLAGMARTGTNFDTAWSILMMTYDNKRVRLSSHLQRLLSMPAAKERASDIFSLLDTVEEAVRSLSSMERPVEHWDDWLVHLVETRLDPVTKKDWVKSIEGLDDFPAYQTLKSFLEHRCRTLMTAAAVETDSRNSAKQSATNDKGNGASKKPASKSHGTYSAQVQLPDKPASDDRASKVKSVCSLCKGKHFVSYCPTFVNSGTTKRWAIVKQSSLCYNCLRPGHSCMACPSATRCRIDSCNEPHHSFLHQAKCARADANSALDSVAVEENGVPRSSYHTQAADTRVTLLATARILLETPTGETLLVRALLDPGSEVSFLTERVVQALRLAKKRSCTKIFGVGGPANARPVGEVDVTLRPANAGSFKLHLTALVLPRITTSIPGQAVEMNKWAHIAGLQLADPRYNIPGGVDCLLGADVYHLLLLDGLKKGGASEPIAQNTVLGWVLTGPASGAASTKSAGTVHLVRCHHTSTSCCQLRDELRRFWEQEEIAAQPILSKEDRECEEHYIRTHSRDETGRYVLRLPFSQPPTFPGSFRIAKSRLLGGGERRHLRKPAEQQAYQAFMQEYLELGHMERVPEDEINSATLGYYIPHFPIFRLRKTRVVFNASQAVENGLSLNACLHSGPKMQTDTPVIITRWRFFRNVFAADIIKMFRQFRIHSADVDWLRILWRSTPEEAVQHYRLTTVTYGTACAPFQAIRTLRQLANDERKNFPLGAALIENHTYVDDIFAGADTLEEALEARRQLIGFLHLAGMKLDKWSANDNDLLASLNDVTTQDRLVAEEEVISTLGLRWKPVNDQFCFRVQSQSTQAPPSKRGLLSTIARMFDPVGWLAPVLIVPKIQMQRLWIRGCDWDQELDTDMLIKWTKFHEQLLDIEDIRIPRFFRCGRNPLWFLHGFSDASELAYAAALYLVVYDEGQWRSSLIIAKSKVAPIKTISIPRLELCGALLLARLIAYLTPQLLLPPSRICCWSDSTVTLAWLRDQPSRWRTFVANRVSEIHSLVSTASWSHVTSEDNPADCASRGLSPRQLKDFSLWWNGPPWLCKDWSTWEPPAESFSSNLESKPSKPVVMHAVSQPQSFDSSIARFSNLHRLLHAYAYVLRWLRRVRRPASDVIRRTKLTAEEITEARCYILKQVQAEFYEVELKRLQDGAPLPRKSQIHTCVPFLDELGVLRVGGRLGNFALSFEEKHPALVPLRSHLAALIIREAHARTLHGGPQLVISLIRRRYWIPRLRNTVRRLVRLCIRCTRFQGRTEEQQMAPLPAERGELTPAFSICGLDFAGPFPVRTSKGRGQRATKGYVCLFVCFSTRAVHLEVVSDLSTQMFLAAFRRFIGRRGLCHIVYSDNGTNFQGASAEIKRLFDHASSFSQEVAAELAQDEISWRFIPPRAPHFSGLWEAGVKAFKYHLKRVIGDATLTFEEFSTLTVQIEACLNSRPISPLSSNPEDLTPLTPGHFLIGRALKALPEHRDFPDKVTGAHRYHLSTVMKNHFWRRWQQEVLHEYQLRGKWLNATASLKEGDLVLVTDINLTATKWPMARILRLHLGKDGLPRVATLRTASSILDRPIVKLVRLPLDTDDPDGRFPDPPKAGGPDISTAGGFDDEARIKSDTEDDEEEN